MNGNGFTDYYEVLQVSSNAGNEIIEPVFQYLARKFHQDNRESGGTDHFRLIVEAHRRFHLWYLKAKGLVDRLDNGKPPTTLLGTDHVEQGRLRLRKDRLLTAGNTEIAGEGVPRFSAADVHELVTATGRVGGR